MDVTSVFFVLFLSVTVSKCSEYFNSVYEGRLKGIKFMNAKSYPNRTYVEEGEKINRERKGNPQDVFSLNRYLNIRHYPHPLIFGIPHTVKYNPAPVDLNKSITHKENTQATKLIKEPKLFTVHDQYVYANEENFNKYQDEISKKSTLIYKDGIRTNQRIVKVHDKLKEGRNDNNKDHHHRYMEYPIIHGLKNNTSKNKAQRNLTQINKDFKHVHLSIPDATMSSTKHARFCRQEIFFNNKQEQFNKAQQYFLKANKNAFRPLTTLNLQRRADRVTFTQTTTKPTARFWPQQHQQKTKEGRFLSLFTVVTFPNGNCAGASGDNGTCMTARECSMRGGSANGYCANGFGLCCIFMTSCGSTTTENGTYFVNQGYPSSFDGTGSCELTVIKAHPDVCQIRLDFDRFTIAGPENLNHVCNQDQFIVSGGNPVPAICGGNQGSHMYIDAGIGSTNPVKLTFVTSGTPFERTWKVKVTQIPCSSIYKADEGCLQYYTGVSGQVKSFNYDPASGLQLSNQDYGICVRMERNFCGIQYTSCPDTVNNRTRSFTISGNSNSPVNSMIGSGAGPNNCAYDWLLVPCAANVGRIQPAQALCTDRICGGTFSADLSMTPASVLSTVKPFRLWFHTDSVEAPVDIDNRGFCLNFVQQPCTNNVI